MTTKKKISVVSLGCSKNLVDTENMMGLLNEHGFEITADEREADVLLVNTCGFIESAKEESIQTILQLAKNKENRDCKLVVAGCLAQRYKDELMKEMPEIDALIGTGEITRIVEVVQQALSGKRVNSVGRPEWEVKEHLPRIISNPGESVYVKIADGCNNRCSYCAIPYIRGSYRSKPMEIIEQEVQKLVREGAKEVVLVAQDTTRYGYDLYGEYLLAKLLRRLTKIPALKWLRVMYCYPVYFTDELINTMARESKICKYVDLPLQHAADKILKKMHRRGSVLEIKNLIAKLRAAIPNITLRTSFIVGFPGETEEDFQQLLNFMEEIKFDRVGIFKYSAEEGTPAAGMEDQIDEAIKEERYHRAMKLQQRISLEKNEQKIGQIIEVLTEGELAEEPGTYVGRSQADAPEVDGLIYFKAGKLVHPGEIVEVKVTKASEYDLMGVLK
ncbi:ribosomal protein S12 methylthiotransferase [Desulfohalotomaculum tongense]|uniref:30S ribosomal protein S12 methylthiotransferase RimO n=1 Tax=Desulforadius tongensis TaxID=1216062 RepID=UPI00195DD797|nr:30S ribosomal protein S12 methylthiotransferase RimO [Desulforadius tongensis]MBM7854470.1 ribosomal protein S12 methylthiotransferase [Desulforadius tongensis]